MTEQSKTIIYAVSSGEYSDYGINAMFSTREKAEAFVERVKRVEDSSYRRESIGIEEWELDAHDELMRSGLISTFVWFDPAGEADVNFRPDETALLEPQVFMDKSGSIRLSVWARDEAHAIKVASEKRAQYLAEQAGIS